MNLRCLTALFLFLACPLRADDFNGWVRRMQARSIQDSVGVWDLGTGKLVEGHQSELALVPASTTKVISTYAILKTLKPEFEFTTELWGDQQDTKVVGDLVVKGGGDPFLTSERIWMLAQELKARGVQTVTGRLVLDQTAFDRQLYGNGWESTSASTTPAVLPLSVNFNRDTDGRLVNDPDRLAQETIQRIFQQAGIGIGDAPDKGGPPQRLVAFKSLPLRDLVADVNKYSNNFMVEMLVKAFGGGTWPGGVRRIQQFYASEMGLGPDKIGLTDGSGLSKDNRLSARTLATVLRAAWNDFEVGPEMVASMKMIGGEPFQLRVQDPNLARRIRCKTGHLNGVTSVCGYLQRPDGDLRVFAIILNGPCELNDAWELVSRWAN
jgi:D-alanyl-D-alanine carboxypeptidase/D-alanyl-D-alanine-endopeptidase (penicillin-binding protein 4)